MTTVILLTYVGITNAQLYVRGGLKGGLNLSHTTIDATPYSIKNNGFGPGFYLGGLLEFSQPKGSKLKGQAELLLNYSSVKYSSSNSLGLNGHMNITQLSMPLGVKYFVTPRFSINGGISLNTHLNGKWKTDAGNNSVDLSKFQVGAYVGATYYIKKGFFIDARYNYYFGDYIRYNGSSLGTFQLGIGYKF